MDLRTEQDIERLRRYAILLEDENRILLQRIEELRVELAKAEGKRRAELEEEVRLLNERLRAREQELYGRSSEKRPPTEKPDAAPKEKAGQRGHGPREQPALPVVEEKHTLDEADRTCKVCGGQLEDWEGQFEESDEVDVIERVYKVVRHRRQKCRCPNGCGVETAPLPPRLIPGGRYSIAFAVSVAIAKYADHLPLSRQVQQMARQGLVVDSQTLWDQIEALAKHLQPVHEALHDFVLSFPVVGADETTWPLLERGGASTGYAWSVTCPEAVCYLIQRSRSTDCAAKILKNFAGVVITDGYDAYIALREQRVQGKREGPPFEHAHCWAHVRRKFVEAEPDYRLAAEAVEMIGELYAIEREAKTADVPDRRAHRAALRRERSAPVVARLRAWLDIPRPLLPKSSLAKAIQYAIDLWDGLVRFLDNPDIPLDNNATERSMKGPVLGRKNHYGSRSQRGTEVAGLFYSLIETAKLRGVDPMAYLNEAARRAIQQPGTVFLPWDLINPDPM